MYPKSRISQNGSSSTHYVDVELQPVNEPMQAQQNSSPVRMRLIYFGIIITSHGLLLLFFYLFSRRW